MGAELRYRLYVHWLAEALAVGLPESWVAALVLEFADHWRNPPPSVLVAELALLADAPASTSPTGPRPRMP